MDAKTVAAWLEQDPRRVRPAGYNSIYPLNVELIIKKTKCLLPRKVIQNKKVLDLGAGIPYFELWCNQNNAHYTGVEIQRETAKKAMQLINERNTFFHDSIENFINTCDFDNYDVIVLSSTLHLVKDYVRCLEKILSSKKTIIIEESKKNLSGASLSVRREVNQYTDDPMQSVKVQKWHATEEFLHYYFNGAGYDVDMQAYKVACKILPDWFGTQKYFVIARYNEQKIKTSTMQDREWQFNSDVAESFDDHAIKHIPDYNHVIDQLPVLLIKNNIKYESSILDFGCATGRTLRKLRYAGFTNLHGVDRSQAMLDRCPTGLARLHCSATLPNNNFDVIIANWTLHFNKNKWQLLSSFVEKLTPNGIIVLTEKTQDVDHGLYHNWKYIHGVSKQEIEQKEKSLKGIMFLSTKEEYQKAFKEHDLNQLVLNDKMGFTTWILSARK